MLDDDFPEAVKQMKPRRVRISRDVERLLGDTPVGNQEAKPATRPQAGKPNAIVCAACGQVAYISQPHCRCGHYLHGQIEDEYLAWYAELGKNCDLITKDAERRRRPLRWVILAAAPFLLGPLITALVAPGISPSVFLWMVPGVVIAGSTALADKWIMRHKVESMALLEAADLETFLAIRAGR